MTVAMSERLRKRIDALRVEYVKTFEEEGAGFQAEMSAGDHRGVGRRAHRIGGTAGSYQLDDVCVAAQNVERTCESQDRDVLAVLEEQVDQLCEALSAAQLLFLHAST